MRTLFGDAVLGENENFIRAADGRQAVRNRKHGSAVRELFQRLLDKAFALIVKGTGGFVQNQHRRVFQEHARDGNALLLTAGQFDAALADKCVVSVGQRGDKLVCASELGCLDDLLARCFGSAVGDVVQDGAGE